MCFYQSRPGASLFKTAQYHSIPYTYMHTRATPEFIMKFDCWCEEVKYFKTNIYIVISDLYIKISLSKVNIYGTSNL